MGAIESRILEYVKKLRGIVKEEKPKKTIQEHLDIRYLPEELLLYIFSFLNPIEICQNVSKVCKRWNELCSDPFLFRHLQFISNKENTSTVIKLLKMAPFLRILTLVNRTDLKEILEQVWESNTRIKTLIIREYTGSFQMDTELMVNTISQCHYLEDLKLTGCYICGSSFYRGLSKSMSNTRKIKCVHLRNFDRSATIEFKPDLDLADDELSHTYSACGEKFQEITSEDIITLCNKFRSTLTSIKVDFNDWSTKTFNAITTCNHLSSLGVYEAHNFPKEGLLAISTLPKLRFLEFTCCGLSDDLWILVFTYSSLVNLKYLNLCRCNVSDAVAATIGRNMKQLQVLGLTGREARHPLANTWLSYVGVSHVIRGCSQLRVLELMYMDPSVEEAVRLIPEHLPALKKLYIVQKSGRVWNSAIEISQVMGDLVVQYLKYT